MKLHRFYIKQNSIKDTVLSKELVHQMNNVLRLRAGENVVFFNGDGNEYLSQIVSYPNKSEVEIHVEKITKSDVSFSKNIHLFFSIIKKDNVEWILQKGTEIGVTHFIPILSARSEKKDINMERVEKIVIEASEQCGRNIPPAVHPVMKLENVFNEFNIPFIVLEKSEIKLSKDEFNNETSLGLLIGPEGGWTPEELELFINKKATVRSLGSTILRAETAAITSSALLLF